ncbi:putative Holliday junction resolvase [Halopolyspora algeriensis]|uniref:Putative pre-16S rRNA nuclease n=1 Tax=Halopolyspora algeriensis TaxID=1500506 RepID=A0A368VTJ0_9ACTN|nr:Holliday junction resolvase RuvX [Halopolyspora algeriensis]RCW43887.1 putative Holliday junction resolvase [Halopolyspora algeriensis]TQM53610.1 putative Holliday junction resolvase [Halopolyspora algeriensis]
MSDHNQEQARPGCPEGSADPGPGRRLAVDVGAVRVGIAVSDPAPMLATPLVTLKRDEAGSTDLIRLAELVVEYEIVEIVVGLPKTLADRHGSAAEAAQSYAEALAPRVAPVPVRFSDERLTTVTASRMLTERGVRGKRKRAVVDQAAAVEILQGWLDARGRTGREDLA